MALLVVVVRELRGSRAERTRAWVVGRRRNAVMSGVVRCMVLVGFGVDVSLCVELGEWNAEGEECFSVDVGRLGRGMRTVGMLDVIGRGYKEYDRGLDDWRT